MAADQVNVEKAVEKKLHIVNNTQDSIQGLSLWIIHHKADAKKIVQTWAKVAKKSKTNHRLTLFYLCNDVVQNCKRKNAKEYIGLFKEVLTEAVPLVRHESVRASINRMLKIWDERNVYDEDFILSLQELLVTEEERELKQQQEVDAKLLAEFKPQVVVETLRGFRRFETELDVKQRQILSYRIDASTSEAIKRLKDRRQGAEFNHQFEDAQVKVEDYIGGVERVIKERAALIDLLAMTEHFYELQYGEAKVVANAYKNFGTRVNKQRRHLEEVKRTLPEVMSPLPSPCMDAPSPTGSTTPPDLAMPSSINNQVIDMELDEDVTGEPIIKMRKKEDEAYSPRSEDSPPSPEGSPIDLQLSPDTTKEDMDIVKGTSHVPQYSPRGGGGGGSRADNIPIQVADAVYNPRTHVDHHNSGSNYDMMNDEVYIPQSTAAPVVSSSLTALAQIRQIGSSGDSTPVKDEGDTTPTQDEFPDSAQSNPVDFLTRLINQSKKSTELSPSLLQNLSMLRETVKKQATVAKLMEDRSDKEKSQSPTPTGPSSWAAWKAQKQTVSLPDSSGESTPVRDMEPVANQIHNGRKSLDERLQKQLEDAARIANAPPPPPPDEHYTLLPDDFGHALLDQLPMPNEAMQRLNPDKPVQAAPVHDHMRLSFSPPRLSFSPPQVIESQHSSPDSETRAPLVIHFNQPKKSILKNSSNITLCGENDAGTPANPESSGLSIPTIGGLKQRPMRPAFPPMPGSEEIRAPVPTSGTGTGTPTSQVRTSSAANMDVQNEFINKLKQKTATSLSHSVPVQRQNSNTNLRTVITVDAGLPPPPPPPGPPPPTNEDQQDQYQPQQYNPEFTQQPPSFDQQYDPSQTYPEPPSYNPPELPPFDPSRPPPTSTAPPFDPTRPPPFDFSRPPPQDLGKSVPASPHGPPVSPRGPPPGDRAAPPTPPAEPHPIPYSPGGAPMHYGERRDSFPGDSGEHFNDRRELFPGKSPGRKHFDPRPPFDDDLPPRFPPPPPGWRPPPREHFDPYRDHYGRPLPKRPIPPPGPGFDPFFPRRY